MIPFLKCVAEAYLSLQRHKLNEYCFLFPNKRSAAFFNKYLAEGVASGESLLAPEIVTVNDFIEELSGLTVDSHLDLLLTLYDSYLALLSRKEIDDPDSGILSSGTDDGGQSLPEFDSFVRWGETVLNDFNDVDLFLVNHEVVFRNVKDFREISTDYLTETQREVMREYFNFEPSVNEAERFWEHFPEQTDKGAGRFRLLWEILNPLYKEFSSRLLSRGLATRGMAARHALQRLRELGREAINASKFVAVGFNVLTVAEYEIFNELSKLHCDEDFIVEGSDAFADFFWDATGPVLGHDDPDNSASRFVRHNIRKFPAPRWAMPYLEAADSPGLPEVLESVAAPSNSMQAKLASAIVQSEVMPDLVKAENNEGAESKPDFSKANVAVVLPDEGLLFPLLYALPEDIDINLTMGYPLRQTAALTFVALLRRLLSKRRLRSDGTLVFYKPDLVAFLSHPFVMACGGVEQVRALNDFLSGERLSEVSFDDILAKVSSEKGDEESSLVALLRSVMLFPKASGEPSVKAVADVTSRIAEVLTLVKRGLWGASEDSAPLASRMDVAHIDVYLDALTRLYDAVEEHGVAMSEPTALFLADRLLGAEKVEFEGEPLRGLQVIGLLETRGLDFEYLVIPSLNERIFPRKARSRSFIPDVLRRAYGMPPSNYQESLFSYYFYRMISRARKVWMIHDARMSTGSRNGEPSRYISQLRHLYAPDVLVERECSFVIPEQQDLTRDIVKDAEVMRVLESYKRHSKRDYGADRGEARNFSASTLKHYLACPARFYYQDVVGFREKDTLSEDIDAISMGNVFHTVMENLYPKATPSNPARIDAPYVQSVIADKERILDEVRRAIVNEHYRLKDDKEKQKLLEEGMPGGVEMVAKGIADDVVRVLRHDLTLTPFSLLGSELKETFAFPVKDPKGGEPFKVNMKFAIDRLDFIEVERTEGSGKDKKVAIEPCLRIVDYKTGVAHIKASSIDAVFTSESEASHIFQLMLYARMLPLWQEHHGFHPAVKIGEDGPDPMMEIYQVGSMRPAKEFLLPEIADESGKKRKIERWSDLSGEFSTRLDRLLSEIFDPDIPFRHTADTSACRYCHLRDLCRR